MALGSALLLVLSLALINVGAYAVLRWYYAPRMGDGPATDRPAWRRRTVIGTAIVLAAILVLVGAATVDQLAFERTFDAEIEETLESDQYDELTLVTARFQYAGEMIGSPSTVTVSVSRAAQGEPPQDLADTLARRITDATGREVEVHVQFSESQRSSTPTAAIRREMPAATP